MKLIDLHCDTIDRLMEADKDLYENNFSVDIKKLKKSNSILQVFALYFDLNKYRLDPYKRFEDMYEKFNKEIIKNREYIGLVTSYQDIVSNINNNKISAILSIEEGGAINGNIDNLYKIHDKGVRLITLTWNYENEIGYPHNNYDFSDNPLKSFGKKVVECMNELNMIIDVSHLNDGGFYDVANISKKPFIASHSNARSITNVTRNLSDDMIKILANSGGVMGINFCSYFTGKSSITKIDDIIHHIKHIANIGGIDVISIGSDFDGIENIVEVYDIGEMEKLYNSLKKAGFKEDEIDKMMYKNALRVIKDVL